MKLRCALISIFLLWQVAVSMAAANDQLPIFHVDASNLSPLQKGLSIGKQAKQQFPTIEQRYDAWLEALFTKADFNTIRQQHLPVLLQYIDTSQLEEMQGVSDAWQLVKESHLGDGELSREEYYILNLLPDLGFAPDGIGLGAFGQITQDHFPIIGHNLEWRHSRSIRDLQTITVYTGENIHYVSIGPAGLLSSLQGFNQYGMFAALMNAEPYSPYPINRPTPAGNIQLTSFSVRRVLTSAASKSAAHSKLKGKQYNIAHSLLLADKSSVQVHEYSPTQQQFQVRYWDSPLQQGVRWDHWKQIIAVDCLMLATLPNTCHDAKDQVRWQRLDTLMDFSRSRPVTSDSISQILFDTKNKHYELFNQNTLQSLYFLPKNNALYLYTPPINGISDKRSHRAYLDLLPQSQPWRLKLKWFIWPLILLMTIAVIWSLHRKDN